MIYGYARASTEGPSVEAQVDQLCAAGAIRRRDLLGEPVREIARS